MEMRIQITDKSKNFKCTEKDVSKEMKIITDESKQDGLQLTIIIKKLKLLPK